jgi:hypothetical protein
MAEGEQVARTIPRKDYSMLDLIFVAIGIAGLVYLARYYRRR